MLRVHSQTSTSVVQARWGHVRAGETRGLSSSDKLSGEVRKIMAEAYGLSCLRGFLPPENKASSSHQGAEGAGSDFRAPRSQDTLMRFACRGPGYLHVEQNLVFGTAGLWRIGVPEGLEL